MAQLVVCPHCGRQKPEFAIVNGRCREDIRDEERVSAGPPAKTWNDIRGLRAIKLEMCDWTQAPDAPLSVEVKAAWVTYRQDLRNLPETYAETGPESVIWPTPPN